MSRHPIPSMSQKPLLKAASEWSEALRYQLGAQATLAQQLEHDCQQAVGKKQISKWFDTLEQQNEQVSPNASLTTLGTTLRLLRQRVFYTLMVRDITGQAGFDEVTLAMSALADFALEKAYLAVSHSLAQRFGYPIDPDTQRPQELIIVTMGKLGGYELNVSSDIDLIFLYGREGKTNGRRAISNHEFFAKTVQQLLAMLSETTAYGKVFRTDLRLRPDADAGPLACSLAALEHYLINQGHDWERYAWIKARPLVFKAFTDSAPQAHLAELQALRTPFVYRKYFDFDALASLRHLRERIRHEWQKRASSQPNIDTQNHIKLGDGGIREIEFVVQLNQLVRGGRNPSTQKTNLLAALSAQRQADLIEASLATALEQAYRFLRRTEHFLQYRNDEQTHLLPNNSAQTQQLAKAMGYTLEAFNEQLAKHRQNVQGAFQEAFRIAGLGHNEALPKPSSPSTKLDKETFNAIDATSPVGKRLVQLQQSPRIRRLPTVSQDRLNALLPALLEAAAQTDNPEHTSLRLLNLTETIAPRSAYLALLSEYPDVLARLTQLFSASQWAAQYLTQYPLLLDSLIEWQPLMQPIQLSEQAQQLHTELDACRLANGKPDIERQMNFMRDFQRQISFQLLVQDIAGKLSVEKLADELSALADLLLEETLYRVIPLIHSETIKTPAFAILAYGKLGGKELGYASDLDLVFVYDDPNPDAPQYYTRLGQRMVSWLTTLTSSGRLYEVDLRLRPDGDAGVLAVSFDGLSRYQLTHAKPWEHQALTRARFAAGDKRIGLRFERLRRRILLLPRNRQALKYAICTMRDKIRAGHPNNSQLFDIKHDIAGMVDIEFITQYLVLLHAAKHPQLLGNLGNIALLNLAAQAELIPMSLAKAVAASYRDYRRLQHRLRLDGAEKARIDPQLVAKQRHYAQQLWNTVFHR